MTGYIHIFFGGGGGGGGGGGNGLIYDVIVIGWTDSDFKISRALVEIDHEIFSMVILSFPLIQEGQLSVSGERMCTILVNRLED